MRTLTIVFIVFSAFIFNSCKSPSEPAKTETAEKQTTLKDTISFIVYELGVKGMTCLGCEQTIQESINSLSGIKSVAASHKDGKAIITLNPELADTSKIREKISNAGYTALNYNTIDY